MIKTVTVTGADDSSSPADLVNLYEKYPFVEWGILYSYSSAGHYRFPTRQWIDNFRAYLRVRKLIGKMPLSLHLWGKAVKEFCYGEHENLVKILGEESWGMFDRVQLNFHNIKHKYKKTLFASINQYPEKEFIFQNDEVNEKLFLESVKECKNTSMLYDKSGGNGILPSQWTEAMLNVKCGYAGGLSPDNIIDQLPLILKASKGDNIWIDVETGVRSCGDMIFDTGMIESFLFFCKPYIKE